MGMTPFCEERRGAHRTVLWHFCSRSDDLLADGAARTVFSTFDPDL